MRSQVVTDITPVSVYKGSPQALKGPCLHPPPNRRYFYLSLLQVTSLVLTPWFPSSFSEL